MCASAICMHWIGIRPGPSRRANASRPDSAARRSPAHSGSLRRNEGQLLEANHWNGVAVAVELRYGRDLHQPSGSRAVLRD